MDSDDEDEQMFVSLLEEETAAEDEEHMRILVSLISLYAVRHSKSQRGGSTPGRRKAKARQCLKGYVMLYAIYFTDDPCTTCAQRAGGRSSLAPMGSQGCSKSCCTMICCVYCVVVILCLLNYLLG